MGINKHGLNFLKYAAKINEFDDVATIGKLRVSKETIEKKEIFKLVKSENINFKEKIWINQINEK